ncbi:MAG: helix-turn-helix domain-containing protein [Planctomycetota bacterium]
MNAPTTKRAKRNRTRSFPIETKEKWDVVCSAVRFELLEFLVACGPCSIAELASHVGAKADSLYHHIRKMTQAGLVVETELRRAGRQTEAVYDVVADQFEFDTDVAPESLMKLMRSLHRRSERNFEKSLHAGAIDFSARSRNAFIRGETARLTAKDLRHVKKLLTEIMDVFEEARTNDSGTLFSLGFDLMPLCGRVDNPSKTTAPSSSDS